MIMLRRNRVEVFPWKPIRVARTGSGEWFSIDNKRLWMMKVLSVESIGVMAVEWTGEFDVQFAVPNMNSSTKLSEALSNEQWGTSEEQISLARRHLDQLTSQFEAAAAWLATHRAEAEANAAAFEDRETELSTRKQLAQKRISRTFELLKERITTIEALTLSKLNKMCDRELQSNKWPDTNEHLEWNRNRAALVNHGTLQLKDNRIELDDGDNSVDFDQFFLPFSEGQEERRREKTRVTSALRKEHQHQGFSHRTFPFLRALDSFKCEFDGRLEGCKKRPELSMLSAYPEDGFDEEFQSTVLFDDFAGAVAGMAVELNEDCDPPVSIPGGNRKVSFLRDDVELVSRERDELRKEVSMLEEEVALLDSSITWNLLNRDTK